MVELQKEIREQWFKNHIAKLTQQGNLQVLDWSAPKNSDYHCRYIFDGNRMYVSGDIGEAIFWFSSVIDLRSFEDTNIGYFNRKLVAFSGDKIEFNKGKAHKEIEEWKEEMISNLEEYTISENVFNKIHSAIDWCYNIKDWEQQINFELSEEVRELDQDYGEWLYDIGNDIPSRIVGYLVGLKMAVEQLKEDQ